jgi:hypothetical protein
MSRLYDSLKDAEKTRSADKQPAPPPAPAPRPQGRERRRSTRLALSVPILIYGRLENGEPFQEETRTLQVATTGCLFTLKTPVKPNQHLVVISRVKDRERVARVAYVKPLKSQLAEVGVEFLERAPDFWPIAFPPEE